MSNPLGEVHDGLWTMLLARPDFANAVPVGRRVVYHGGPKFPAKDGAPSPGVAEVRLLDAGHQAKMFADSAESFLTARFALQVATGEQDVATLLAVKWSAFRALHDWRGVLGALTWSDKTFVQSCRILRSEDTMDDAKINRGVRGWSTVCEIEVLMTFKVADLQNEGS